MTIQLNHEQELRIAEVLRSGAYQSADDPEYIVRLVGQVIDVSLGTVKPVKSLPAF